MKGPTGKDEKGKIYYAIMIGPDHRMDAQPSREGVGQT
jgi:hypothetical protein